MLSDRVPQEPSSILSIQLILRLIKWPDQACAVAIVLAQRVTLRTNTKTFSSAATESPQGGQGNVGSEAACSKVCGESNVY